MIPDTEREAARKFVRLLSVGAKPAREYIVTVGTFTAAVVLARGRSGL